MAPNLFLLDFASLFQGLSPTWMLIRVRDVKSSNGLNEVYMILMFLRFLQLVLMPCREFRLAGSSGLSPNVVHSASWNMLRYSF